MMLLGALCTPSWLSAVLNASARCKMPIFLSAAKACFSSLRSNTASHLILSPLGYALLWVGVMSTDNMNVIVVLFI